MRRALLACAAGLALLAAREARAREAPAEDGDEAIVEEEVLGPPGELRAHADVVSFDARAKTLELAGNVRLDGPPFHLRAQRIALTRTRLGIEVEGKGTLAFCPCLGTPLTVSFDGGIVAPPGDLVLRNPALRVYGVPVAALPYFWLRSEEKVGLLPPDVAYRGRDGLFAGGGVHIPWRTGPGRSSLDLRSGAYLLVRGFVLDARLRTPASSTKVRFDRLPSSPSPALPGNTDERGEDGLLVDARGATRRDDVGVAWDVDLLRGRRGVASTTDLDAAAKPWDRLGIEAALRGGGFAVSTGVMSTSRRGGGYTDIESAGPVARVRASGAVGTSLAWDATVEGGALRVAGGAASLAALAPPSISPDTLSFARAEVGLRGVVRLGPAEGTVSLRGAGDAAKEGRRDGTDGAGAARVRLGLPLARTFSDGPAVASPTSSPLVHVVEPFAEAAVLHARGDGLLGVAPGRGLASVDGTAPLARAGVASTLGRWSARDAVDVEVSGGAIRADGPAPSRLRPVVRARGAATSRLAGFTLDGAHVAGDGSAWAFVTRLRVGASDGLRALGSVAVRDGVDPLVARALADAPLEPGAGFLAREGTTGGAGVVVPWTGHFRTSLAADADLSSGELVGARAGLELRDRCSCVTLRAMGSHRIGRSGVDVWLALDFAADR